MATPLGDNQKVSYAISAADAKLNPAQLAAGDTVSVTSSDTDSVTVVPDITPVAGSLASGFLVAGAKLQAGVVITASALLADGTPDATVSKAVATIDVIGGVATNLSITLGSPIFQ